MLTKSCKFIQSHKHLLLGARAFSNKPKKSPFNIDIGQATSEQSKSTQQHLGKLKSFFSNAFGSAAKEETEAKKEAQSANEKYQESLKR